MLDKEDKILSRNRYIEFYSLMRYKNRNNYINKYEMMILIRIVRIIWFYEGL